MLEFKHLYRRKMLAFELFMKDDRSRSLIGANDFLFREFVSMPARLGHSHYDGCL